LLRYNIKWLYEKVAGDEDVFIIEYISAKNKVFVINSA